MKAKRAPKCKTSKTSWYVQDQYTSNKSEPFKKIKLSELDNENISAGRIMIEIDFFFFFFTAYISSIILLHIVYEFKISMIIV